MILVKSAGVFMHELLPLLWDGTLVTLQITVFGSLLAVVVALRGIRQTLPGGRE
jgi:polar amino acid transport system permease protein